MPSTAYYPFTFERFSHSRHDTGIFIQKVLGTLCHSHGNVFSVTEAEHNGKVCKIFINDGDIHFSLGIYCSGTAYWIFTVYSPNSDIYNIIIMIYNSIFCLVLTYLCLAIGQILSYNILKDTTLKGRTLV